MYASFEDVQNLNSEDQRALLFEGDAPERVWATWALALDKVNTDSLPVDIGEEPSAGVRLNLIVLVAAAGDRSMLETLASNDPDVRVRASACQYIIKINPSHEVCDSFIESVLFSAEEDTVKVRILSECTFYRVPLDLRLIGSLIASRSQEVRSSTIENLKKNQELYDLQSMQNSVLIPAFVSEVEPDLKNRLYELCRLTFSAHELMHAVSKHDSALIHIIESIESSGEVILWGQIQSLIAGFNTEVQSLMHEVVDSENNPDCIQWAINLTNMVRHDSEYDDRYLRSNLFKLLQSYSGTTVGFNGADELLQTLSEEKKYLKEDDYYDWYVEEELKYLDEFSLELSKWSCKEPAGPN